MADRCSLAGRRPARSGYNRRRALLFRAVFGIDYRVILLLPLQDSAGACDLIAALLQNLRGARCSNPMGASRDDQFVFGKLLITALELAERDVDVALDRAHIVQLFRLPDVEEANVLFIEQRFQLVRGKLLRRLRQARHRRCNQNHRQPFHGNKYNPPLMAATKCTSLSAETGSSKPTGLTSPSTATEMLERRRPSSTSRSRMPGHCCSRLSTSWRTVAPSTSTVDRPPVRLASCAGM